MKSFVLVLSLLVFAGCTKKAEPVVKDKAAFAEEACYSLVKEGTKVHNNLVESLKADKKTAKKPAPPLFNSADADKKIREEVAKPGVNEKAFARLEADITKADPTFVTECKAGFNKFLDPCVQHTDKPSFEKCFATEFKKEENFAKGLIGRVSATPEFEKLKN